MSGKPFSRELGLLFLFSTSLTEKSILPGWERRPFATGVSRYADHDKRGARELEARIYLEVQPGLLEGTVSAVVDTAAPWCIFSPSVCASLREDFDPVSGDVLLSTRLGTFRGSLYLVPISFPALQGEALDLQAMVFVSPDWPGGNFLGYQGLLQRIRFAVDPEANLFYFGQI
jgi:hypothetical protein